ncbi:hypothetical protein [Methylocapsa acidiphila]|uniref:hypothetical protein n=1 Tax=Methylocapsa acidiphila TaxID=133552 RepID=UPI0012EC07CF|nr:hypothetical protein [Methylocapsa acidiphila]
MQPDRAAHVVGDIGEPDLHLGSGDANGSHDEPHRSLPMRKDVLDLGADFRFLRFGDVLRSGICLPWGFLGRNKAVDRSSLHRRLAKGPDRVGARHRIGQAHARQTYKRQPVLVQILGALIRKRMRRRQDQYFQHQDVIERQESAFRAIGAGHCRFRLGPKRGEDRV